MRWLTGVVVVCGAGMAGWGWWLGQRQGVLFVLRQDPDSGVRTTLTANGTGLFLYPVVALTLMLLIAAVLHRRRDDIRTGLTACRERPVVFSLAMFAWAAVPWCCGLVLLLLEDWARDVPMGSHLFRWVLADRPFTWFLGTLLAVITVFFALTAPWLTDHLSRLLRYERRFRRLRSRGEGEALSREILKLGEEMAERPYREQVLISLLLRIEADRPTGEVRESLLSTLARVPRLDEAGWLFTLSPLASAELKMRVFFADALLAEYYRTDAAPHLEVAVRILEGLRRRPPLFAGRGERALVALALASALGARHTRRPDADGGDLERALALAGEATATLSADATGEVTGQLLLKHYDRHGEAATLDRAVEALRPAGPSPVLLRALVLRHRAAGNGSDLAEAVTVARDLATDDPHGEHALFGLLFTAVQEPQWWSGAARDTVTDVLDTVDSLPDVSSVSPLLAQLSAICRAALALLDEDGETALSWYEHALTLMGRSASLGLSRDDRQAVLGDMVASPTQIADIALSIGQVERAVELLELGRTVIWSQTRRLRRTTPPPGVAARLAELRAALDRPGYPRSGRDDLLAGHHAAGTRAELAAEWERLTAHHGPARPMSFSESRESARGGPVVVLNVSDLGCAAVIVTPDRPPVHVPLPDADHEKLATQATGPLTPTSRRMNARALARYLWDSVAGPVLEAVEPHLGPDRRIWWCPTGPLSYVPVHLAGYHDQQNGPALIDHVVSSYTPSLWALLDARRTMPEAGKTASDARRTPSDARQPVPHAAVPAPTAAMLVASLRTTPDPAWPELPHAEEEAAAVTARFPGARRLAEHAATVSAVRAALYDHPWVHIACHGDQGGLVLHDGHLSLDELADMDLTGDRLAFLSACVTALPDARTAEEVLHPAAAFHLNGFSHVIGTMWQIDSSDGPTVADDFYRLLRTEGYGPAAALHHAQLRLRSRCPDDPWRWAPFVHIGP